MKIIEKLKKGLIAVGTFFMMLPSKVVKADYSLETFYGVAEPEVKETTSGISMWNILKIILIPIILLIGCIVYICKSKSSKKTKIIVAVSTILLIIAILLIGYSVINILN